MEMEPKRVATLAVFEGQSLLMGIRRDNGKWTTPGGHLNPGEAPLDGALRELREETGIEALPHELEDLGSVTKAEDLTRPALTVYFYKLRLNGRQATSAIDPDEEVHYWTLLDVSDGFKLPPETLHVPKNDLLRRLGLLEFQEDQGGPTAVRLSEPHTTYFPPERARMNAVRGLEVQIQLNRGVMGESLTAAKAIIERQGMTEREVLNMARFFDMHGTAMGDVDHHDEPTARAIDCELWGGFAAMEWAKQERTKLSAAGKGRYRMGAPTEDEGTSKTGKTLQEVSAEIQTAGTTEDDKPKAKKVAAPKKLPNADLNKPPEDYLDEVKEPE